MPKIEFLPDEVIIEKSREVASLLRSRKKSKKPITQAEKDRRAALARERRKQAEIERNRLYVKQVQQRYPDWDKVVELAESDDFKEWFMNWVGMEPNKYGMLYSDPDTFLMWVKIATDRQKLSEISITPDENLLSYWKRRKERIKHATPAWFDSKEYQELVKYRDHLNYIDPSNAPHHIDHVIPLQGRTVCGLHVHTNMEVIPGSVNSSKSNNFPVDGLDI